MLLATHEQAAHALSAAVLSPLSKNDGSTGQLFQEVQYTIGATRSGERDVHGSLSSMLISVPRLDVILTNQNIPQG